MKNNSYTLIDGILLSRSLSDKVGSACISHYGNNVSDHSPVEISMNFELELFRQKESEQTEYVPWSSLSDDHLSSFSDAMEYHLRQISVPFHSILHGNSLCHDNNHVFLIEKYYEDIVRAIIQADSILPRKRHGLAKHFWSEELNDLKLQSLDAHNLWKDSGCPRAGNIFMEKNSTHLAYKRALRRAKREDDMALSDDLSYNLLSHDSDKFWRNWNRMKSRGSDTTSVDGEICDANIANAFAHTYSKVYSDIDQVAESRLSERFKSTYSLYKSMHESSDVTSCFISWSEFLVCISKIKNGKATGSFK